jgi:hypothetical protein
MKVMFALSLLFVTACATITHGPNETIAVDSQPRGAATSITCDHGVLVAGTTPASLVIPRKAENCVVEVSQGDRKKSMPIERGISGKYWMNFAGAVGYGIAGTIAFGKSSFAGGGDTHGADQALTVAIASGVLGGLGFIIDSANGSMWDHNPSKVTVDLEH